MTDFANFLFLNEIPKKEIAEFLGVSNVFVSKLCKGEKNLPKDKRERIMNNPYGWDTSPLKVQKPTQSIGDNSNNNTQIMGENEALRKENELLKKLLEEKERTIQILMNK